jgi:hypothetical protein
MRIDLQWKVGWFVANKGMMISQYHNPDGDSFSVEIGMA